MTQAPQPRTQQTPAETAPQPPQQQVPTVPVPEKPSEGPFGLPVGDVVGIALVAAFVLLMVLAARRLFRRKAPPPTPPKVEAPPPALPAEVPQLRIELPRTQAELARLREAEEAHLGAEEATAQRRSLEAEAARLRVTDAEAAARAEAGARAAREREQALKRDEYRARKAAEDEAKERRRQERAEAERLLAEEEARARAEVEALEREARAAEERKVQAQAGLTLADGLDKTRSHGFMARLNGLFGRTRQVDESVLGELEEILFTADIGVRTASRLVDTAREKARRNELASADGMKAVIRDEVASIVDLPAPRTLEGGGPPHVVMVVGVNGAGKTTTIGKLARKLTDAGRRVVLAAGDTFRAAATEQLDVWAERAGAQLVKGPEGGDPGSVVFEAIRKAQDSGADVVIADTAGRLHTKAPLMEELRKVRRVMDKALPGAPHTVLLVLDATMGQNAIQQAKQFNEAVGVNAIALTKLDGTAKGGVVIGICDELRLPVAWVGVGERVEDLRPFEPREFVSALFD
ncbi:MAG: signal recognition particle-docking protein FtsY [Myxococcaceae bacterium]|nr:signal recognition particle-docking protein FtsY [Myxococcaceae bacterium]MCI0670046.1 signal recognition particle-docking protein FtsY [Myxococcaceae bacterium]